MSQKKLTPFERLGGRPTIARVIKIFYDKVFAHPWIGQYFRNIPQEHIENQQVDFMSRSLNGPNMFSGRTPKDAHVHMVINDELFDLRNRLLTEAMNEAKIPLDLQEIWLKIDEGFRGIIVKDASKAKGRWTTDPVLNFKKPA